MTFQENERAPRTTVQVHSCVMLLTMYLYLPSFWQTAEEYIPVWIPSVTWAKTSSFQLTFKAKKKTGYGIADLTGQKADRENLVRAAPLQRTLTFRSSLPCCHRPSWVLHSGWTPGKSPLGRCCFYHWPLAPHRPFLLLPQSCHWKPAKDARLNTLMQSCSNQNTFRLPWLSLHPRKFQCKLKGRMFHPSHSKKQTPGSAHSKSLVEMSSSHISLSCFSPSSTLMPKSSFKIRFQTLKREEG